MKRLALALLGIVAVLVLLLVGLGGLLLGTIDPLLAGITQEATRLLDPQYEVYTTAN